MAVIAVGILITAAMVGHDGQTAFSGRLFLIGMFLVFATASALLHILLQRLMPKISMKITFALLILSIGASFLID